jgi:hypothetical protein
MPLTDALGLAGVLLILAAYAGGQVGRLPATGAPALVMNLVGALLILSSMVHAFNLSAALMEGAWAVVAAFGLVRLALGRRRPG